MGPQTYSQGRCKHRVAGHCIRAEGLTFMVVDFQPWTLIGMCRICAVGVRPDLIYQVEKAAG